MKTVHLLIKTVTDEMFTTKPRPLYGEPRPMVDQYLKNNMPFTVETPQGPIIVNSRHIVYVQEVIGNDDDD